MRAVPTLGVCIFSFAVFFLSISSSWVNIRLHTENQLYTLPGSALKVCVVVGGVESEFSDRLWLELSLGQADPDYSVFLIFYGLGSDLC
jgi:hypothetical protein